MALVQRKRRNPLSTQSRKPAGRADGGQFDTNTSADLLLDRHNFHNPYLQDQAAQPEMLVGHQQRLQPAPSAPKDRHAIPHTSTAISPQIPTHMPPHSPPASNVVRLLPTRSPQEPTLIPSNHPAYRAMQARTTPPTPDTSRPDSPPPCSPFTLRTRSGSLGHAWISPPNGIPVELGQGRMAYVSGRFGTPRGWRKPHVVFHNGETAQRYSIGEFIFRPQNNN